MREELARIVEITSDPYGHVARLKEEKNKRIIGCFPMHIPEEIVHAADLIPVMIWRSDEPVTHGHTHITPYNCGIVRSFIDDAVKEKLAFMDGMVFHVRQCLLVMECPLIVEKYVRPDYQKILYMPPSYSNRATRNFLLTELETFRKSLEDFTGNRIGDENLHRSIEIYNENRSLLRRIYDIRREKPGIFTSSQVIRIVWAGMLMLKEDHNELLRELIRGVEGQSVESQEEKIRVIPVGCLCQTPQFEVLDMIEDMGMIIPDDDLFVGSRYFANEVNMNGNPLGALADRYLTKTPVCPTKGIWDVHWGDEAVNMVKRNKAKGIISIHVKFCPPHACYYPDFKSKMEEEGVPEVMIQVEHEMVSMEATRTKLQTFAESLGGA